jgi:hypothetical protein
MLNVKIFYHDSNEPLYCTFDKELIRQGEKYAVLYTQMYSGEVEKLVYRLENLPTQDEFEDDIDEIINEDTDFSSIEE